MATAHAGLEITSEAFDKVVQHLAATMTSLGVPDSTIGQIATALLPLKADIVTASEPVSASPGRLRRKLRQGVAS